MKSQVKLNSNYSTVRTIKRNMLSRTYYMARTAYHVTTALLNNDMINQLKKDNHTPLVHALSDLALDPEKGIDQLKTSLCNHMIAETFLASDYYSKIPKQIGNTSINIIDAKVSPNAMKEVAVVPKFTSRFGNEIINFQVNNDSIKGNFPNQKQTNHDFWLTLKSSLCPSIYKRHGVDNVLRPQDEKAGAAMFENTTRGHIGVVYFDKNFQNYQFMPTIVTKDTILEFNKNRIRGIRSVLKTDAVDPNIFDKKINYVASMVDAMKEMSIENIIELHTKIDEYLWVNIQCDPRFTRSISFVMADRLDLPLLLNKGPEFEKEFLSKLSREIYNLDKIGERKEFFNKLFSTYFNTVDRKTGAKLEYLEKNIGLKFNSHFLHDLKSEFGNFISHTHGF